MNTENNNRLLSLDTLRGFDMLFIMGLASLIVTVCNLLPCGGDCAVAQNMRHVEWNGLRHHDTIFPLFLFIAGISWPFSFAKQQASGRTSSQIVWKVIRRGIALVLLGIVYGGFFKLDFQHFRIPSVLGRIGLAWMSAALIFIFVKHKTWRIVIAAALLLGYWGLLQIPAPDYPGEDSMSRLGNIVGYVGRLVAPNHLLQKGEFDPECFMSTFPAIVTAMLGMFTGEYVKYSDHSGNKKSLVMLAGAAALLVAGLVWSTVFPINKMLWTSTFVLVVGAYSLAMFALFYWMIDVKGWKRWTFFFKVIGVNSITIYMAQRIINFRGIADFFLGGFAREFCSEEVGTLVLQIGYIAVSWLFLYFLYKKKVFLKV